MGEYAKRISDGNEIKIGTCESMYYIRYEDRNQVTAIPNNFDCSKELDLRWRLPFPDEDDTKPGDYQDYDRGCPLYQMGEYGAEGFTIDGSENHPGSIQLKHESGLLLSMPCYHGSKLPTLDKPAKAFWNGKQSYFFELKSIKNTAEGIYGIVSCRFCDKSWVCEIDEIIEYISNTELAGRLKIYCDEKNEGCSL